jgi:3-oxoacyl-[acyl-carrier-protein] synthase-1
MPAIASTKSLTGHALGAAGSNEAVYSLIMMNESFLSPSVNIEDKDPAGEGTSSFDTKKGTRGDYINVK